MVLLKICPAFWKRLFFLGCILYMFGLSTSSNLKKEYSYAIDVHLVDRCPVNESDWQSAAARIGCNKTLGYHCVPDKFHSRLIEFCYNRSRIFVAKGNCLELAAYGVLNFVKCHEFSKGCPDEHYFSNEIYRYPSCLSVAFQCFTSDIKCLDQKFKEQLEEGQHPHLTAIDGEAKLSLRIFIVLLFLVVVICCGVFSLFLLTYRKRIEKSETQLKQLQDELHSAERRQEVRTSELKQLQDELHSAERRQEVRTSDDLQVLRNIESELVFDDIYLALLIRRHCRNGVFENFIYLLERAIKKKKNNEYDINLLKILTSRDKEGCNFLHSAAEGGSVDIFEALMEALDEVNKHVDIKDKIQIDDTTYDGRSVLHLACKNKHRSLCRHLLINDNYKNLLLDKMSVQGWNAAHFAAMGGDIGIMDILESKNLDIKAETKNGMNILDIACLCNNTEMCKDLMNRENLSLLSDKSDARGWTIAHFAAMTGNTEIFYHLIANKIKMVKTKSQKNILHICCEYGHEDLCLKILNCFSTMLDDKDDGGWNVLHYAAKGGSLKVFKKIETLFKGRLWEITDDERTVLHIACINKRIEICQYICEQKTSYKRIIHSKGEFRNWTAAHYVAVEERQNGTEEKLIRILESIGIDLQATTVDGLTVLGVACEHRNRNLIDFLLKEHNELLGVGKKHLIKAAEASNDVYIEERIKEALRNYHGKIVEVEVSEISGKKGFIRLAFESEENSALKED